MSTQLDLGGNTLIVEDIKVGATAPGQAGTSLTSTELLYLDALTAGTVSASKAVVVDASKNIGTFGTVGSAAHTITSASASALAVGLAGATNPSFSVDSSTGSQAAGLKVTGATAAGTVAQAVISSGSDANLTINAKGTGTIGIGSVSTGAVTVTPALNVSAAITGTSASATSLAVGLAGATNPAFVVDSSTGSQAAGLKVTGATSAGTVAAAVISSGSDANLTVNAKGSGTIGIGSASTGAVTITPATTVTGIVTPTGGIAAAGGYAVSGRAVSHTGGNPPLAAADGTNLDIVTTETYRCEVFVPANFSSTGIAIFNGTAVAGNLQAYLIDSTGAQVGSVQTASTGASGTTTYQRIPWTGGPYTIKGPATYWVAIQGNNSAGDLRTHVVGTFGADKQTSTSFGTLTVASAPTTFTTGQGPFATLY